MSGLVSFRSPIRRRRPPGFHRLTAPELAQPFDIKDFARLERVRTQRRRPLEAGQFSEAGLGFCLYGIRQSIVMAVFMLHGTVSGGLFLQTLR